jgi:hypothetical protein
MAKIEFVNHLCRELRTAAAFKESQNTKDNIIFPEIYIREIYIQWPSTEALAILRLLARSLGCRLAG